MFEIEWKKEKSVFRNLLQIKGVSHTLATNLSASLGISKDTKYGDLDGQKVEELNMWVSNYKKSPTPFKLKLVGGFCMPFLVLQKEKPTTKINKSSVADIEEGNRIIYSPILSSLESFRKTNIKMLITSSTLRGRRLKQGYPVRGQRTRSNGKTAKRLNRGLGLI